MTGWLIKIGAACTALAAIGAVLAYFAPFFAWASDIKRLDRNAAESAVQLYSEKVDRLTLQRKLVDPGTADYDIWKRQFDKAQKNLEFFERRKIELSK